VGFKKKGDSGSYSVVNSALALNINGAHPRIDEDGVFGAGTVAAVKAFPAEK
jgi:peptidoglycan hydrolase-like protein with peptidoglycan-binding domain